MRVNNRYLTIRQHHGIHRTIHTIARLAANDLIDVMQVQPVGAESTANHAVRIAFVDHHCANQCEAPTHLYLGKLRSYTATLHHQMIGFPIITITRITFWVDQLEVHIGP